MKDLISHKNRTNIISITRNKEDESSNIIGAINNVTKFFLFESLDQKRERLAKLIYTINLLDIQKDDIVFELGTGDGLKAAIMAEMGARVITVSSDKFDSLKQINAITSAAKDRIQILTVNEIPRISKLAPFDKILVGQGVSNIPVDLYGLISLEGKLVVTENHSTTPTFLEVTRTEVDKFDVKRKCGLKDKSASYEVFDL